MREFYSDIEISAPPETVWSVVTDFESFPEWNPFIRRCSGEAKAGGQLHLELQPPGGGVTKLDASVVNAERNRELRWVGRSVLPGMLGREYVMAVEPLDESRTRFIQSGMFTGLMSLFVSGAVEKTRMGAEAMNEAIKERAERMGGDGAE